MEAEITVIITTCSRGADTVMRAVDSVLAQSFCGFELIVVDDTPPELRDSFGVLCALQEKGDPRIRYMAHERNLGACAARNTGIREGKGNFFSFLDDDDEYLPDKLERQLLALRSDEAAGMVVSDFLVNKNGSRKRISLPYTPDNIRIKLFTGNRIATPNPLIRRECFERCGVFDEAMPSAQDADMWERIMARYPVVITKDVVYIQNIHTGERISGNPHKKLKGGEMLIEKNRELLSAHPRVYSFILIRHIRRHILTGDGKEYSQALKAIKVWPPCIFQAAAFLIYYKFRYERQGKT